MVDHRSSATFRLRMLTVARTEIHWGASQLLWSLVFEEMMVFNDYINTYTYGKCICLLAAVYVSFEYFTSVQSRVYSLFLVVHGMVSAIDEVESWSLIDLKHYIILLLAPLHIVNSFWEVDHMIYGSCPHTPCPKKIMWSTMSTDSPGHIRPENHRHKKCWPSVVCG